MNAEINPINLETDVLVVGAGGAGMYAAVAASRGGAKTLLVDKSLISRGGATIMAQMTVAVAVGEQEPDHWTRHLEDTLAAGRGLCNEELARILCEDGPARIREMDNWKVGWAREDGHLKQVSAPGHQVERCVYVDFLNTGPAVAKTLRTQVVQAENVTRISGLSITGLSVEAGRITGAIGFELEEGRPVVISANAVVLAAGGLTRLYRRNSASVNMGGDSYALALEAGAELIDMEFVQFFPIGHLAPRLVGMDPIMWDPFRYKLGGRLLNGEREEFIENYGGTDSGVYTAPRDITSYAIVKEVEAGRGSPHGGAWLSFEHISEVDLRDAFGPVIDRLLANGIDLTKQSIEVAPIAHYHMGGVRVNTEMETRITGLFAAGEAVGGANGANRLSGNAITEALVYGERAGRYAALAAQSQERIPNTTELRMATPAGTKSEHSLGTLFSQLQTLMWKKVGLFRTAEKLTAALARIREMRENDLPALYPTPGERFALALQEWYDLKASLLTAEAVTVAAIKRTESRGAHQREDWPETNPDQAQNQVIEKQGDTLALRWIPVVRQEAAE